MHQQALIVLRASPGPPALGLGLHLSSDLQLLSFPEQGCVCAEPDLAPYCPSPASTLPRLLWTLLGCQLDLLVWPHASISASSAEQLLATPSRPLVWCLLVLLYHCFPGRLCVGQHYGSRYAELWRFKCQVEKHPDPWESVPFPYTE